MQRRVLLLLALLLALAAAPRARAQCATIRVRREWRELTSDQRTRFINAVRTLNRYSASNPGASIGSPYNALAKVHIDFFSQVHNSVRFLPWHRAYIRDFERKLQAIDSSVTLPYWDSSYDAGAPETSPVLAAFGGNSANQCLRTGPFANWYVTTGGGHCLRRNYNQGSRISSFVSLEALSALISRSTTLGQLSSNLEYSPHGSVHVGIGGDMSQAYSPNDPIFWLHHANYDKQWAIWQRLGTSYATDTGGIGNLPYYNVPVTSLLNTRGSGYCYTYTKLGGGFVNRLKKRTLDKRDNEDNNKGKGHAKVSRDKSFPRSSCDPDDRSNKTCTHYIAQLPDAWIEKQGFSHDLVRANERFVNTIADGLNAAGIVSESAEYGDKNTYNSLRKSGTQYAKCEGNPTCDKYLKKAVKDYPLTEE